MPIQDAQIAPSAAEASVRPVPSVLPEGVHYRAIAYGGSGYADGNLGVLLGLREHGIPVRFEPVGPQEDERRLMTDDVRLALGRMEDERLDPINSIYFQSCPAQDMKRTPSGRVRIGRTYFETDRLPAGWLPILEEMDEVWVPSDFNRRAFASSGLSEEKIRVVHEGVDARFYSPEAEPFNIPHARSFKFLSVFDWQMRKGPDLLLKAFVEEFDADDDVCLILKLYTIHDPSADPAEYVAHFVERHLNTRLEDTAPIILLNGFIPNSQMPRLFASGDAYVLPTRGEGFGRPYLEALSTGLPVIATRWSGQLDFLNDQNSYLVDVDDLVPFAGEVDLEIAAGHRWASPNVEHLRQRMRHVVEHQDEARERGRVGRNDVVEQWDWSVRAKHWASEFQRLLNT